MMSELHWVKGKSHILICVVGIGETQRPSQCKATTYHSAQTLTWEQFIDLRLFPSPWEYPHEGTAIQYNNATITQALNKHYSNLN